MASKDKSIQDSILQISKRHKEPIPASIFQKDIPHASVKQISDAINVLLKSFKLSLFQEGGVIKYKATAPQETRVKGLTAEDMLVLQVITNSGNLGIWTRDMKSKTNLPQPRITKILKTLEERGLIKSVKSVQNASRKVYMLAELEPAKELTGGPWYGDNQNVDEGFIETLREVATKYIKQTTEPKTLAEVTQFITDNGISNQELQADDVKKIIDTLLYDRIIDGHQISYGEDAPVETIYSAAKVSIENMTTIAGEVPCGRCPVFNDCHEGGMISPETCVYYKQWLTMDW